jgi:uncharacterized protein YbbK (DUF523 family)
VIARVLVSACLLGEKVRYNGRDAFADSPIIARWQSEGRIIAFCPEVAGGLGVPRPPAEIQGGGGGDVLNGGAAVATASGADVTDAFIAGARQALAAAVAAGVRAAVLKDGSPSCATTYLYDGSFTGARRSAPGVTAALLERHGIRVFNERELDEADGFLRRSVRL